VSQYDFMCGAVCLKFRHYPFLRASRDCVFASRKTVLLLTAMWEPASDNRAIAHALGLSRTPRERLLLCTDRLL